MHAGAEPLEAGAQSREQPLRVVLADDHDVVRRGLAMVLEADGRFAVVAEARTGAEAIDRAVELHPDLLILDVRMPVVDGIQAARSIRRLAPGVRILILTGITASPVAPTVLHSCVDGYIPKCVTPKELVDAAYTVASGWPHFPRWDLHLVPGRPAEGRPEEREVVPPLTPRELEILRLIANTQTNASIALRLRISENTVRSHVKHILQKLGQPTRARAVAAAVWAGLLDRTHSAQ